MSRLVGDDEPVMLLLRRHWVVLVGPVLAAALATAIALLAGWITGPASGNDPADMVAAALAAIFLARLAWKLWRWTGDHVVVTERRILHVSGTVARTVTSVPLSRLSMVTYQRSAPGRLLGYGDLGLASPGGVATSTSLDHIPHPDHFYMTITALIGGRVSLPEAPAITNPRDAAETRPIPRVIV